MEDWVKPQMPQMGADAWVADRNLRKSVKSAVQLLCGREITFELLEGAEA